MNGSGGGISDNVYVLELDLTNPEDIQKVGTQDYIIKFDDCSFIEPTCMIAQYTFKRTQEEINAFLPSKYTAMMINYQPLIAEKESQIDKIKNIYSSNVEKMK